MRYPYPIASIDDYDVQELEDQIRAGGFADILQAVHAGNSALILEFSRSLSASEATAVKGILAAYAPTWFTWTEDGIAMKAKVRCADDVDRVTGQRIRRAIGGQDPIQEQLKILRLSLYAHEIRLQVLEGKNPTQTQIDTANTITAQLLPMNDVIEVVRAEGAAFKTSKGW